MDANEGWEQYYDVLINPVVIAEACKGASCSKTTNANPTATAPTYCTIGDPNCPTPGSTEPPCKYGVDPLCMPPPVDPPPPVTPCRVGIDPACTVISSSTSSTSSSSGYGGMGSSSSSSGGMPGYLGSDGQLYSDPNAVPGQDEPCGDCNRVLTTTYEKDVADAAGEGMRNASSIGGSISNALSSIGNALSSIAGAIASFFSSFFSSPEGGGSSSGGGNTSSNSGQHADGSGGESGNNTSTTGHAGGCGSSGC